MNMERPTDERIICPLKQRCGRPNRRRLGIAFQKRSFADVLSTGKLVVAVGRHRLTISDESVAWSLQNGRCFALVFALLVLGGGRGWSAGRGPGPASEAQPTPLADQEDWGNVTPSQLNAMKPTAQDL
jgi:hypothetical protein